MLNIISSDATGEYKCQPQPIVNITHKFTSDQLEQLLRVAVRTLGADEVARMVGISDPRGMDYMVFVEGGENPRAIHTSYATAKAEAKRLAKRTGRKATVLKIVAYMDVRKTEPEVFIREFM